MAESHLEMTGPDFAAFLVGEGIDSISLNPDSYLKTVRVIADVEGSS